VYISYKKTNSGKIPEGIKDAKIIDVHRYQSEERTIFPKPPSQWLDNKLEKKNLIQDVLTNSYLIETRILGF